LKFTIVKGSTLQAANVINHSGHIWESAFEYKILTSPDLDIHRQACALSKLTRSLGWPTARAIFTYVNQPRKVWHYYFRSGYSHMHAMKLL